MNVKLLRKVKAHILEEPKRLFMASYIRIKGTTFGSEIGHRYAKCGTAACIAGWACILAHKKTGAEIDSQYAVGFEAMKLLGLDPEEKYRLFEPMAWPEQFRDGIRDDGKKKTAEVCAARIEHFIKTKGRE